MDNYLLLVLVLLAVYYGIPVVYDIMVYVVANKYPRLFQLITVIRYEWERLKEL